MKKSLVEQLKTLLIERDYLMRWHHAILEEIDDEEIHPVEGQLKLNECWKRLDENKRRYDKAFKKFAKF